MTDQTFVIDKYNLLDYKIYCRCQLPTHINRSRLLYLPLSQGNSRGTIKFYVNQMDNSKIINKETRYHEWYNGSGPTSHCKICHELISEEAAYVLKNNEEDSSAMHKKCPLNADYDAITIGYSRLGFFVCNGCRHFSIGFGYYCAACDFKLDFRCAFNLQIQPREEETRKIKADFHEHKLHLDYHC